MHVLGFLCNVLPCLVYTLPCLVYMFMPCLCPEISSFSSYGKQTKVQVVDLAAGAMSGELRQGSFGFASQLFSSLTKLMDRNSFLLLRCICLCRRTWDCGICVCSFYWALQPGFLWAGICSDGGNLCMLHCAGLHVQTP